MSLTGRSPSTIRRILSGLEFYGRKPFAHPVHVQGCVTNHAGALVLEGTMPLPLLELVCDRCGKAFSREKTVALDTLVADHLEEEESDSDIFLLDGTQLDSGRSRVHGAFDPRNGYQKPLLRRL